MLAYPKCRYGVLPSLQRHSEPSGSSGGRRRRAGGKAPPPCRPPALHANHGQMDAIASAGLKRKFEDADVGSPGSNSDDEISNSDSADSCDSVNPSSSTGFIREWVGDGGRPCSQPPGASAIEHEAPGRGAGSALPLFIPYNPFGVMSRDLLTGPVSARPWGVSNITPQTGWSKVRPGPFLSPSQRSPLLKYFGG